MIYAIIETGGKQYAVSSGTKLKIEKLPESKGIINFDKVLFAADDKDVYVGKPYLGNATVSAERIKEGRSEKVLVFRYHSKTRYRKKKGHRQPYTEVLIKEIKLK